MEENKLRMEFEFKSLQAKFDAGRTLAEDIASQTNLHVPDENRGAKAKVSSVKSR